MPLLNMVIGVGTTTFQQNLYLQERLKKALQGILQRRDYGDRESTTYLKQTDFFLFHGSRSGLYCYTQDGANNLDIPSATAATFASFLLGFCIIQHLHFPLKNIDYLCIEENRIYLRKIQNVA